MKNVVSMLAAAMICLSPVAVYAAEPAPTSAVSQDAMAKDAMGHDAMGHDAMGHDAMAKDAMAKDCMAKTGKACPVQQ